MRSEQDSLGSVSIPATAYWGAQSQRTLDHFGTLTFPVGAYPVLASAIALVKKAATSANMELDALDADVGEAIVRACDEVIGGALLDHFVVDMLAPSDTAFNMNASEVLANRANELLGFPIGSYQRVHPLDHVNRSQSTNDVIHTAFRVVTLELVKGLSDALSELEESLLAKAAEYDQVLKMGRTCLQDALPISFGEIFRGYASTVRACREALAQELAGLSVVNLGGTAIGTGFNAPDGYGALAVERLSEYTDHPWRQAASLVGATQNDEGIAFVSGKVRVVALSLSKIATDLRLMSSGPTSGLREIRLPALQAGSSIMPDKVNPIATMLMNQTAYLVAGFDAAIGMATEGAELELNANGSLIGYCLLEGFRVLESATTAFARLCIHGLTVNEAVCEATLASSPALATALTGVVGYETASKIAAESLKQGRSVLDVVTESGIVDAEVAQELLDPRNFIRSPSSTRD